MYVSRNKKRLIQYTNAASESNAKAPIPISNKKPDPVSALNRKSVFQCLISILQCFRQQLVGRGTGFDFLSLRGLRLGFWDSQNRKDRHLFLRFKMTLALEYSGSERAHLKPKASSSLCFLKSIDFPLFIAHIFVLERQTK